jgi:DNA polymerase III delta subunit
MSIPRVAFVFGDPFRCEQALSTRHAAILEADPQTERRAVFGDETDLSALATELSSAPLFAEGRHFVVRHAETIKPKPFARLAGQPLSEATYVTFVATGLKGTNPLVKAARKAATVQSAPRPSGARLTRAAAELLSSAGLRLAPRTVNALVERCGGDLLALAGEARKLKTYGAEGKTDSETLEALVFSAGEASIYPLLDRIGERNLSAALTCLAGLHEDAGRLLSATVRHLSRLLMVHALLDAKTEGAGIGTLLGSPSWLVARLAGQAKRHTYRDLVASVDRAIELDLGVKCGQVRAEDALLLLILAATTRRPAAP